MSSRLRSFTLYLFCGALILVLPLLAGDLGGSVLRLFSSALMFLLFLLSNRIPRIKIHAETFLAFTILSLLSFLEYIIYRNQSWFHWISPSSLDQYVILKVLTMLLATVSILVVLKLRGRPFSSVFLQRGKVRLSLMIGVTTFFLYVLAAAPLSNIFFGGHDLTLQKQIDWAPWILCFVLSNGLKEELQFRGIFMKAYQERLGPTLANILQAIIFTLPHIGEGYSPMFPVFLLLVLILGVLFGAAMQKTRGILASTLLHAGADIPVILGIFSNI